MKIKMLQTRLAGAKEKAKRYEKGVIYEVPDKLGISFLTEGVALPVRQPRAQASVAE